MFSSFKSFLAPLVCRTSSNCQPKVDEHSEDESGYSTDLTSTEATSPEFDFLGLFGITTGVMPVGPGPVAAQLPQPELPLLEDPLQDEEPDSRPQPPLPGALLGQEELRRLRLRAFIEYPDQRHSRSRRLPFETVIYKVEKVKQRKEEVGISRRRSLSLNEVGGRPHPGIRAAASCTLQPAARNVRSQMHLSQTRSRSVDKYGGRHDTTPCIHPQVLHPLLPPDPGPAPAPGHLQLPGQLRGQQVPPPPHQEYRPQAAPQGGVCLDKGEGGAESVGNAGARNAVRCQLPTVLHSQAQAQIGTDRQGGEGHQTAVIHKMELSTFYSNIERMKNLTDKVDTRKVKEKIQHWSNPSLGKGSKNIAETETKSFENDFSKSDDPKNFPKISDNNSSVSSVNISSVSSVNLELQIESQLQSDSQADRSYQKSSATPHSVMAGVEHTPLQRHGAGSPATRGARALSTAAATKGTQRGTQETPLRGTGVTNPNLRDLESGEAVEELLIKIDPGNWGIEEWVMQTVENCRKPFLNSFLHLHNQNVEKNNFSWFEDESLQQYLAINVIRVARIGSLIPAALKNLEIDDLYSHDQTGEINGVTISLSPKNVLSGIDALNPQFMYCHQDPLEQYEWIPEAVLRSGQVKLVHLLEDLKQRHIPVRIEYSYGITQDEEVQNLQVYSDDLLKGPLFGAVKQVSEMLNDVYNFQNRASALAQGLEELSEEVIESFECSICEFQLSPNQSDLATLKGIHHIMMAKINGLKKAWREYEEAALEGADEPVLTQAYVEKQFQSLPILVKFLKNDSSPTNNYIKFPNKWTTQRSQCMLSNGTLQVTASPSRLFVPKNLTPISSLLTKVKDLADQLLKEISDFQKTPGHQPPGQGQPAPRPNFAPKPGYPHVLLEDAEKLIQTMKSVQDTKSMTLGELEALDKSAYSIMQVLQSCQWQHGVLLNPQDKEIEIELKDSKSCLVKAISEQKGEQRIKDLEAREISKTMSSIPAVKLDKEGKNVMAFIEFHEQFKSVNKLHRSLKIKNGLLNEQLRERLQHESEPQEMLDLIKKLYLAEDIILPKARSQIEALKQSPSVGSKEEGIAYSEILGFISKLKKAQLMERLDFSTITLAISKVSRVRQDQWEQKWLEQQMLLEGASPRTLEDKKREMFIHFIQFNETLIHRTLLQKETQKGEKEKVKVQEKVFSTVNDLRKTKYDQKRDKKTTFKAGQPPRASTLHSTGGSPPNQSGSRSDYKCILCGQSGGHPKTFDGPKKGTGARSLARCQDFKDTAQPQKLALVLKLSSCVRCLSTTHQVESCFLSPTQHWLNHSDCERGSQGLHNPTICPKKAKEEKVNRIAIKVSTKTTVEDIEDKPNYILNLLEHGEVKIKEDDEESLRVVCVYDDCSDSNWISRSFARQLPKASRKRVFLKLSTVPGKKEFQTWEHQFSFKVKGEYELIKAYECQNEIGTSDIPLDTQAALQEIFNLPINVPTGKIQILLGMRNYSFHPNTLNEHQLSNKVKEMKVFTSAISEDPTYIVAGSLPHHLIKGAKAEAVYYTTDELQQFLNQQRAIELPRVLCPTCRQRSKKCFKCNIMTKPMSLKEQKEIELIESGMSFDKENQQVTMLYKPITNESFDELFPPSLSNQGDAIVIAKRSWKSLKTEGLLEEHAKAFQKFIDQGVFSQLTEQAMTDWDEQGKGSNFVTILPVRKVQSNSQKLSLRLVTNSSQSRWINVGGQRVRSSLNSVLPKGTHDMNSLVDIVLQWFENPISLIIDQKRAYNVIKQASPQMSHLRRMVWFKDTAVQNEKDLELSFFCIDPVHFGDAPAASCLAMFRQEVINDLKQQGKESTAELLESSSYVDDNAASLQTVEEAFKCFTETKEAFGNYGAEFHDPIVSSRKGRFDTESSKPRLAPKEDEEEEERIFGYLYSSFSDQLRLPIQRNLNKKKKGIRMGENITQDEVDLLDLTMRKLSSFLMSIHDLMGFLNPVLVEGKILLSQVQEALPPNIQGNWDQTLPPDLLTRGRSFIKKVVSLPDLSFPRSPPSGQLKELHVFVDGAYMIFGLVVYGIWKDSQGNRVSKLLLSRNKISRRQIPDQELSGFTMGLEVLVNMKKLFKDVDKAFIFSDSEASVAQVKSSHRPKDVYKNNRYNSINASFSELEEDKVKVSVLLVRSKDQAADPVTKVLESSVQLVQSKKWLQGPDWLSQPQESWPTEQPSQEGSFDKNGPSVLACEESALVTRESLRSFTRKNPEQLVPPAPAPPAPPDDEAPQSLPVQPPEVCTPQVCTPEVCTSSESSVESLELKCAQPSQITPDVTKTTLGPTHSSHTELLISKEKTSGDSGHQHSKSAEKSKVKQHYLSPLLYRCSNVNIALGALARVKLAFRQKSFKAMSKTPDQGSLREAFHELVKKEQQLQSSNPPESLMTFQAEGMQVTRQRWSSEAHQLLFGCFHLPVLPAKSKLGLLLLQRAHRSPSGPCATDQHCYQRLRTGNFPIYLFEGLPNQLKSLKAKCVDCKVRKFEEYSAPMKHDYYKTPLAIKPFQTITIDMCGPIHCCHQLTKETRGSQRKWVKKYVLVIMDNSGVGACNFVQMGNASAQAVCIALQDHFAKFNQVATKIYTDLGSNFVSVSSHAKRNTKSEVTKLATEGEQGKVDISPLELSKQLPSIEWTHAKSSAQYRNGLAENGVKSLKKYISGITKIKPDTSYPRYTVEGLNLVLQEASTFFNSRPVSWLKDNPLTPAHFLYTSQDEKVWSAPGDVEDKFLALEEIRGQLKDHLISAMQCLNFIPNKWYSQTFIPCVGDVIYNTRGKTKYNPRGKVEYAKIVEVSEDNRNLKVKVVRSGVSKLVEADARNCVPLFQPSKFNTEMC